MPGDEAPQTHVSFMHEDAVMVALLLYVLWVRSYEYYESVLSTYGNVTSIQACNYFDFWYAVKVGRGDPALSRVPVERYSNNVE